MHIWNSYYHPSFCKIKDHSWLVICQVTKNTHMLRVIFKIRPFCSSERFGFEEGPRHKSQAALFPKKNSCWQDLLKWCLFILPGES